MSAIADRAAPPLRIAEFELNSDSQAITALDRKHKYVINLGGKGSGKTATHLLWALDRGTWDTEALHGIFTNTERQLKEGVFAEFEKLPRYGVEWDYGINPKTAHREWVERWRYEEKPYPHLKDYRGIFYTSEGLHAMCGTLFNQNYTQYESLQFASERVEEIPALSKEALNAITSRLRCGMGPRCSAEYGHRHQAHLFGNPPVGGAHPWLFDWLDTLEEGTKRLYHVLASGAECSGCEFITREGRRIQKHHGPALNHRQWPLLRAGIGNTILIKSRTSDNRQNLNEGYEDDIAMNSDKATVDAWLSGELTREISAGCYSESFSDQNVREVAYDPDRTLFVCIDINIEPRVSPLAHPLMPGEYPSDWERPGVEQLGVFGEFFSLGGMSDRSFAEAMMAGKRGTGDAGYQDEQLRGLPENWQGLEKHRGPIIFYGDAEGNRRSAHSDNLESSWIIMRQTFSRLKKWGIAVPDNNPPARARIHSVCAKLMAATTETIRGAPSLSIDPRCRHTIKDFEQCVWNEEGLAEREWRQGAEMLRTHCAAAVGYMVHERSPYGKDLIGRSLLDALPTFGGEGIKIPRMSAI